MKKEKKIKIILALTYIIAIAAFLFASLLLIIGCRSPEFTSALMYVNENNHEKAEAFFNKALIIEPENALVPYFYAYFDLKKKSTYLLLPKIHLLGQHHKLKYQVFQHFFLQYL